MRILLTGGTGFIGSALTPTLIDQGHSVTVLTRQAKDNQSDLIFVNTLDEIDQSPDVVINLAGASLAAKRWNSRYKAEIVRSRVDFTQRLVSWMKAQAPVPKLLISGSAIGYYGASLSAQFDEDSAVGAGFSAQLCHSWEAAAQAASSDVTRVVLLRLGVVFDEGGGALREMMRSFQLGVGSWLGSGDQWLSWVHRADVVRVILRAVADNALAGPLNVVAPQAVTHRAFCDALAVHKPVMFKASVPACIVRVMLGEVADELLLAGQHVNPTRLDSLGFAFDYDQLTTALAAIVGRQRA